MLICNVDEDLAKNNAGMEKGYVYGEDYKLRGNITDEMKQQQRNDLKNGCGFVI